MYRLWIAACWVAVPLAAQEYAAHGDPQLAAYISEALSNNPGIKESFARYRAARQRIARETALPDPTLEVMPAVRNPGMANVELRFSQALPWFGKRRERGAVAHQEAEVAARLLEAAQADAVREVKQSYFEIGFLDAAAAVTDEEIRLLGHFERLAQARYAQGEGLQQEAVKLQAEITRLQNRLEDLRIQRVAAEAGLNAILDRPPDSKVVRVELPARPGPALNLEVLQERARTLSPEMRAAFEEIEKDEKRIHAARKEYWPDVRLGAGFASLVMPSVRGGRDMWTVSVGVDLPINRRRRDAAVLEAAESMIASKEAYRRRQNEIVASIRALTFRLETVDGQIRLLEGTLLPQAKHALRTSEDAYSTGAAGVLDLLDSERMLLDIRLGLARLHADYLRTLADLERAVGGPIPEVNS